MKKNNLQSKEDLIKSISLTVQLQKSLKKLLTDKKKSKKQNNQPNRNQKYDDQHVKLMEQLKILRIQREELLNDNKQLSKQVLGYKQHVRELTKEVSQLKKYVDFLQNYNNDLKREMSFWLKKPKQTIHAQNQSVIYHKLSCQIDSLKKQNDLKQKQLLQLHKTFDINVQTTESGQQLPGKKLSILYKENGQNIKIMHKLYKRKEKKQQQTDKAPIQKRQNKEKNVSLSQKLYLNL